MCSLPLLGRRDPVNGAAMPSFSESCRRADMYHQVAIHRELLGDPTFVRASGHSTTDHVTSCRDVKLSLRRQSETPDPRFLSKNGTGGKPSQSNRTCPSVICGAGFFDDRYANTTTLIFRNSEKPGKGLDLGFRDNN